jgi:hypothetical protein
MLVDPAKPQDVQQVHALQNELTASQQGHGTFDMRTWDETSFRKMRAVR